MGKEKVKETIIYQEQIPEKVVEELEDGQKVQYFIWDALIKRLSNLHPELLLPVVKESFGKQYSKDEDITFLSAEYTLDTLEKNKNQRLHSIYVDLVFRIGKIDIYHLECQIRPNAEITEGAFFFWERMRKPRRRCSRCWNHILNQREKFGRNRKTTQKRVVSECRQSCSGR